MTTKKRATELTPTPDSEDWRRLYGGLSEHPVLVGIANVARVWHSRHKVDEALVRMDYPSVMEDARDALDALEQEYVSTFGPIQGLVGPHDIPLGLGCVVEIDFDGGWEVPSEPTILGLPDKPRDFRWKDSGIRRAARAYQRECAWDSAPDQSGTWLLYVLPHHGCGTDKITFYDCAVAGFAVIQDRDGDGILESIAHMWVAKALRRRGVGSILVSAAREQFSLTRVEGPVTDEGAAMLDAVWPVWPGRERASR